MTLSAAGSYGRGADPGGPRSRVESLTTWGLSQLSPEDPVFFCPVRGAPGPAGKEKEMGVGFLEHREDLGGSRAGKLALNPQV